MLILMLLPASVWRLDPTHATYQGFDANLIHASPKGNGHSAGVVDIADDELTLSAVPGSEPTATLLTTPFSFVADLNLRVYHSAGAAGPLRIAVWNPGYGDTGATAAILDFNSAPIHSIRTQLISRGRGTSSLSSGMVDHSAVLGRYSLFQTYHIKARVDREKKEISMSVASGDRSPTSGPILRLSGGYGKEIGSRHVSIEPGREYSFGGFVKLLSGVDKYKIVLWWFDETGGWLTHSNDWRSVGQLRNWSSVEFRGIAPASARTARLFMGSGTDTEVLATGLFLRPTGAGGNILPNARFENDAAGWESVGNGPPPQLQVASPFHPISGQFVVTTREAPQLLDRAFLSLTASISSVSGLMTGTLQGFRVTIPQTGQHVPKVRDARVVVMLVALLLAGGLLSVVHGVAWLRVNRPGPAPRMRSWPGGPSSYEAPFAVSRRFVLGGVIAVAFLMLNATMFRLGSYWFDMFGQRVWAYIASKFGPPALYALPNLVANPGPFGRPEAPTIYPYHPVMGYVSALIGWINAQVTSNPGSPTLPAEWLIKLVNVLFALGAAFAVYRVMQRISRDTRKAFLVTMLFLLNPAIWFGTSVWGQTYSVSFFFLLISIWLAEEGRPTGAWLALMALSLTRPQMLVPAFLLSLAYLKKFPANANVPAMAWAIVAGFMLMAPFLWSFGPSLPLDLLISTIRFHEAGGNEPSWTVVSGGAYSVWPIVTQLLAGVSGRARMYYPSETPLIGQLTYQRAGLLLAVAAMAAAAVAIVRMRRPELERGGYLPLVAAAFMAFLMLKTGLGPGHLSFGIPLLLLCTQWLSRPVYLGLVAVWTVTTFISMYGEFGSHISLVPEYAPLLHHNRNPITNAFMAVSALDWSMTLDILMNVAVPLVVVWHWIRRTRVRSTSDART